MCVKGKLENFFDMSVTSSEHQNFYLPIDFDEILSVRPRSTKKMFAMIVTSSEHQNLYLPTDFDKIWYVCIRSINFFFDKSVTSSEYQNIYLPIDFDEILYGCSWVTKIDTNASEHENNGGGHKMHANGAMFATFACILD